MCCCRESDAVSSDLVKRLDCIGKNLVPAMRSSYSRELSAIQGSGSEGFHCTYLRML